MSGESGELGEWWEGLDFRSIEHLEFPILEIRGNTPRPRTVTFVVGHPEMAARAITPVRSGQVIEFDTKLRVAIVLAVQEHAITTTDPWVDGVPAPRRLIRPHQYELRPSP